MSHSESESFFIQFNLALKWLGLGVVAFLFCIPLYSQTSQGTIQGGVFDQTGGAVAGATVNVLDVARGVTRTLTADDAGQYIANGLTPGTYTVRAEAKGFRNVEHSGVLLEVGQNIRVDLIVQPGEQTQTVTVTGEIPAVNTTDSTLGGTVSNQSINDLPLNGRNFQRLLDLRPGNVAQPGAGTGASSTNGRRNRNDILRVEGIAGIGSSATSSLINASFRGGDSSSLLPIDAIQEFNSAQNPKAEYGFRDGSTVNVGIKSGTNSVHGTAYAFGRDASATDAANFFTSQVTPANFEQFGATAGGPIMKDKLFWFASFEGVRDETSQTNTITVPMSVSAGGGAAGAVNSFVDACNLQKNAVGGVNPLSAQLAGLSHFQAGDPVSCAVSPASSTVENIFPYNTNSSTTYFPGVISQVPLNNGLFKGDYALGTHHHLTGLLFISKSQNSTAGAAVVLPQYSTIAVNNAQQYSGDWTWSPNSLWVNDFRLGYVFVRNLTLVGDGDLIAGNPWPNGYGMPTGVTNPLFGGLPAITFTNPSFILGANARGGRRGPQGDVDLVENVSHLRGNHSFKFGFEYIDNIFDGDAYPTAQGTITFASLTTFLQGQPTTPASAFLGDATQNSRMHWYGGFFQDDWRIKPRVTLNLGLRYEYDAVPTERNNYMGNFNPNVNPATTPAIQQFGPGAPLATEFNAGRGQLSPRLGVAWDVRGNGKTVVRAGGSLLTAATIISTFVTTSPFGANFPSIGVNNSGTAINAVTPGRLSLSAAQLHWNTAANLPAGTTIFPTTNPVTVNSVTYTGVTCAPTGLFAGATPCQTAAVDPNFRQPSTASWNLDVQRAITNQLTVDVAYVGNHGYNEETIIDLNQPPIGTGYTAAVIAACKTPPFSAAKCAPDANAMAAAQAYTSKFPYLSQIDESATGDFSNYNGLQATLQARGYHGLSFLAGYTFAHALSISDGNSTSTLNNIPSDKNNLRLNYGNSDFDLRHRFTFAPTYLIPGRKSPAQMLEGWSVNAIVTVQTGLPFTVSDQSKTDWLGTNEIANSNNIGNGVFQYWNYAGPRSAFSNNVAAPTKLTGAAATANATCLADAQAPYAGNATLQALAQAALFNGGCFLSGSGVLTPPAYGTLGNAGGDFFLGPNYRNVDFSAAKVWKWKERYSAQFRVEFFNVLNRTDFGAPGTDPSKGSFGFASGTPDTSNPVLGSGGPRHIQFGLKLSF